MKIKILREELLNPLQQVVGAVERKQTMPALANILVQINNGVMSLTATDLEIELVASSNIHSDENGEVTLPARKLLDICKNLPDEAELTISFSEKKATISTGRSRFVLSTLPANEFPALEDIEFDTRFTVPQSQLLEIIQKTSFAMAHQDVRYYLNGMLLETSGQQIHAVATDGHRLAYCQAEMPESFPQDSQVILPRKGVMELQRLLENSDGDADISLSGNHIRVKLGNFRFTSKLIDGRFPDYQRVMPADGDKFVSVDRLVLRQSLTRTSILSNEKYRGVRLILEGNIMRIQTQNPEQEEAEEELEVKYDNESIEIGFNVNYVLDVLNTLETESVEIQLKDGSSSCLIREPGIERCKYVIMPMRL